MQRSVCRLPSKKKKRCFSETNFSSVSDAERGDDPLQVGDERRGQKHQINDSLSIELFFFSSFLSSAFDRREKRLQKAAFQNFVLDFQKM